MFRHPYDLEHPSVATSGGTDPLPRSWVLHKLSDHSPCLRVPVFWPVPRDLDSIGAITLVSEWLPKSVILCLFPYG